MRLTNLLKKGSLRGAATATPATFATHSPFDHSTVATVATLAVAKREELAANDPMPAAQEQPSLPTASTWRELASAYHLHHFKCPTCISAGQGRGLRCGAGAALWTGYQDASA